MGYSKHNLYWGQYKPDNGSVGLDKCNWVVLRYVGSDEEHGHFTNNPEDKGDICLVLNDEENQFWPVMSFLSKDEAKKLAQELLSML